MSSLSISSSSSSSSSLSGTEGSQPKAAFRRFSAPPVGDTSQNITTSSIGSTFSTHVLRPSLPPLPGPKTTPQTYLSIGIKPKPPYTIHYFYPASSSTKTTPIPIASSDTHLLTVPLRRNRSNSEPTSHPTPIATFTNSSSSSTSDALGRDLGRESKENKEKEKRLLRDSATRCYQKMQWADDYIQLRYPEDYLQRAITLYREVVQIQNHIQTPHVKPYFTLVKLLLQVADPINNTEILQILDRIIQGHFSVWEKVNAYMKKAEIFKKSSDTIHMDLALACWQQAKVLIESQNSDEDEMTRKVYLKACRSYTKEMAKKKQTIEHYTTAL